MWVLHSNFEVEDLWFTLSDSTSLPHHLSFQAGETFTVQSRHPDDPWLMGELRQVKGST
jgi:hypothetical protein